MKKVKLRDAQYVEFWNDTHKLTLIFEPLEETKMLTPTGVDVSEVVIPQISLPRNINLNKAICK